MVDAEIEKAKVATEEEVTLFDRIVKKQIPANVIYEDDLVNNHYEYNCYSVWHSVT